MDGEESEAKRWNGANTGKTNCSDLERSGQQANFPCSEGKVVREQQTNSSRTDEKPGKRKLGFSRTVSIVEMSSL